METNSRTIAFTEITLEGKLKKWPYLWLYIPTNLWTLLQKHFDLWWNSARLCRISQSIMRDTSWLWPLVFRGPTQLLFCLNRGKNRYIGVWVILYDPVFLSWTYQRLFCVSGDNWAVKPAKPGANPGVSGPEPAKNVLAVTPFLL